MVIGLPSPTAASPLLVSRSTGPQPLVADRNGRLLTATGPLGGAAGTAPTIRSSVTVSRPHLAVTFNAAGVSVPVGAVTGHENVLPLREAEPTVQPAGAVSVAESTRPGAWTVAVAVNCWPLEAVSGTCSVTEPRGAGGTAYFRGS